jgi:nitrate reductase gamma subunit
VNTFRAITTGLLVVIAAFVLLVFVPDQLLQLTGIDRSRRVLLATTEFIVALTALLWGLRRLQARRLL